MNFLSISQPHRGDLEFFIPPTREQPFEGISISILYTIIKIQTSMIVTVCFKGQWMAPRDAPTALVLNFLVDSGFLLPLFFLLSLVPDLQSLLYLLWRYWVSERERFYMSSSYHVRLEIFSTAFQLPMMLKNRDVSSLPIFCMWPVFSLWTLHPQYSGITQCANWNFFHSPSWNLVIINSGNIPDFFATFLSFIFPLFTDLVDGRYFHSISCESLSMLFSLLTLCFNTKNSSLFWAL